MSGEIANEINVSLHTDVRTSNGPAGPPGEPAGTLISIRTESRLADTSGIVNRAKPSLPESTREPMGAFTPVKRVQSIVAFGTGTFVVVFSSTVIVRDALRSTGSVGVWHATSDASAMIAVSDTMRSLVIIPTPSVMQCEGERHVLRLY